MGRPHDPRAARRSTRQRSTSSRRSAGIAQINHPELVLGHDRRPARRARAPRLRAGRDRERAVRGLERGRQGSPGDSRSSGTRALVAGRDAVGRSRPTTRTTTSSAGSTRPAVAGSWSRRAREPQAILEALAGGRFYASTGVVLARAEVDGGRARRRGRARPSEARTRSTFIENGRRSSRASRARAARRPVPATGYVRARRHAWRWRAGVGPARAPVSRPDDQDGR